MLCVTESVTNRRYTCARDVHGVALGVEAGQGGQRTQRTCFVLLHYRGFPLLICIEALVRDAKGSVFMDCMNNFCLSMDGILPNKIFCLDQPSRTFFILCVM